MQFITKKRLTETQAVRALLAADISEERVLSACTADAYQSLEGTIRDLLAIRRDSELCDYEEALGMDRDINLSALSIESRTVIARTMIRAHSSEWFPSVTLSSFQKRLFATLPSTKDQEVVWRYANKLAKFHPVYRDSYAWAQELSWMMAELESHRTIRARAAEDASKVPAFTDEQLEEYLYRRAAHCDECEAIATSKVPKERLAAISSEVKRFHSMEEADEHERRAAKW